MQINNKYRKLYITIKQQTQSSSNNLKGKIPLYKWNCQSTKYQSTPFQSNKYIYDLQPLNELLQSTSLKLFCQQCQKQITLDVIVIGWNQFSRDQNTIGRQDLILYCVGCFADLEEFPSYYTFRKALNFTNKGSQWRAFDQICLLNALKLWGFGNWLEIKQFLDFNGCIFQLKQIQEHYQNLYLKGNTTLTQYNQKSLKKQRRKVEDVLHKYYYYQERQQAKQPAKKRQKSISRVQQQQQNILTFQNVDFNINVRGKPQYVNQQIFEQQERNQRLNETNQRLNGKTNNIKDAKSINSTSHKRHINKLPLENQIYQEQVQIQQGKSQQNDNSVQQKDNSLQQKDNSLQQNDNLLQQNYEQIQKQHKKVDQDEGQQQSQSEQLGQIKLQPRSSSKILQRNMMGINASLKSISTRRIYSSPDKSNPIKGQNVYSYNPKRKQFQIIQYDYYAESMLASLQFNDTDSEQEVQLKIRIIQEYNRRLEERIKRRQFVIEHRLLDHQFQAKIIKEFKFTMNLFQKYSRFYLKYDDYYHLLTSYIKKNQINSLIQAFKLLRTKFKSGKIKDIIRYLQKKKQQSISLNQKNIKNSRRIYNRDKITKHLVLNSNDNIQDETKQTQQRQKSSIQIISLSELDMVSKRLKSQNKDSQFQIGKLHIKRISINATPIKCSNKY